MNDKLVPNDIVLIDSTHVAVGYVVKESNFVDDYYVMWYHPGQGWNDAPLIHGRDYLIHVGYYSQDQDEVQVIE